MPHTNGSILQRAESNISARSDVEERRFSAA